MWWCQVVVESKEAASGREGRGKEEHMGGSGAWGRRDPHLSPIIHNSPPVPEPLPVPMMDPITRLVPSPLACLRTDNDQI